MGCQDRGARLQLKAKKRHRKGANIISDHSHVAHVAGVLLLLLLLVVVCDRS